MVECGCAKRGYVKVSRWGGSQGGRRQTFGKERMEENGGMQVKSSQTLWRVLYVVPNQASYKCFLSELGRALFWEGGEVHCAGSDAALFGEDREGGSPCRLEDDVRFHRVEIPRGLNPLGHLRAARDLRRLVRRLRPSLVHAHFSAAIFTTALAKSRGWPPVFGTFHGLSFPQRGGALAHCLRWAEAWSAAQLDTVFVLTEDDRDSLVAAAPNAVVERLESLGVGCDLARFNRARFGDGELAQRRQELGLKGGECVFAFVGRWTDFKGFGRVVRAFLRVFEEVPQARLLLVGGGDPIYSDGLTPTERLALERNPAVIRLGQQREVAKYLAVSDAFVFPSRREGVPVCVMEALAMGVPVLTMDSRGCRDAVRDGVDGEVLADGSEMDFGARLAGRMLELCRKPELRADYGARALEGRERLSRGRFVTEQLGFYRRQTTCIGA
jgi:glycosyltransferase involved in cell wall biosynthesis